MGYFDLYQPERNASTTSIQAASSDADDGISYGESLRGKALGLVVWRRLVGLVRPIIVPVEVGEVAWEIRLLDL